MTGESNFHIEPKKVFLALVSICLAFLLIIISVFSINNTSAAEEEQDTATVVVKDLSEESTMAGISELIVLPGESGGESKVDYVLPYPGILPDHPLYWLKMVRDRIRLWLTRDPVQKTQQLILYADKRIGAGRALIEGNKKALGVTTITKAEKYLEKALGELKNISNQTELKDQLYLSASKHMELMSELEGKVPESLVKPFIDSQQINSRIIEWLKD